MLVTVTTNDPGRAAVWGGSVPSVLVVGGAAVGAAAGLWASSLPGSSLLLVVGAVLAWIAAGAGWLLLVGSRVFGRSRWLSRPRMWGVVVAPILVVATVGLVASDAPLRARWSLSRDAFDTVVENGGGNLRLYQRIDLPAPRRLGLYRVAEAYQLGDGVFVVVDGGGGLMSIQGFAHLPTGPNPVLEAQYEGVDFHALGDDWYVWGASV